jgi:phage tail sheath protein FI
MTELQAGIKHIRDGVEPQVINTADMSVIGIIGTAPAADDSIFPLNTPIQVDASDKFKLLGLGTTGTLPDAIKAGTRNVVVRVEDDASAATVIGNMLGSQAAGSGVWAFLDATDDLGITPRLLIAPGYTSQAAAGLVSINVANGGEGYTSATIALSGGDGTGATAEAIIVDGEIVTIALTSAGTGYTSAPTITITGDGSGAAATAVHSTAGNAVCAIMPTICRKLSAIFLPEGPTDSRANALTWLEALPASEFIAHPLRQTVTVQSGSSLVEKPASPFVVAGWVNRDAETDGVPTRAAANMPLEGIVGVTPSIPFDITDGSSLGQQDLEKSFGIIVQGQTGSATTLTDKGFSFWGTDTLSESSEFKFANVLRMRLFIHLTQVRTVRVYLGKFNITTQTVQAILNTMKSQLSQLKAQEYILDYRLNFNPDHNLPGELRAGQIDTIINVEEPPVLKKMIIRSRRYEQALTALSQTISTRLRTFVN